MNVTHLKLLPAAVDIAMQEDKAFREGMPVGYPNYGGLVSEEVKIFTIHTGGSIVNKIIICR
jgi:hypothetical protein